MLNGPVQWIDAAEAADRRDGVHPESSLLPAAGQTLLITRNPGSFFKRMGDDPGVQDRERSGSIRFEIFQGCPMDCTYCFCQEYLSGHHTVLFMNIEDCRFETAMMATLAAGHHGIRLVTGDIADSLALGDVSIAIHEYAAEVVPGARFELRSKFRLPDAFERLDPERFRIDWSLSPDAAWRSTEVGTASTAERIESIGRALNGKYEVAVRLDPLQPDRIDPLEYDGLLSHLKECIAPDRPDRFIVGSYKMTPKLIQRMRWRFPEHPLPGYEWTSCPDGKLRPFRSIRLKSYTTVLSLLQLYFPEVPVRLSMELPFVLNLLNIR